MCKKRGLNKPDNVNSFTIRRMENGTDAVRKVSRGQIIKGFIGHVNKLDIHSNQNDGKLLKILKLEMMREKKKYL